MPETYNEESIHNILQLAMSRQGQSGELTRSQLQEIADELGISAVNLAAAEEDWGERCQERSDRYAFDVYRHLQLRQQIVRCVSVCTALSVLNLAINHALNWAIYPTLAWSCLITLQAWRTYQHEGEQYDRAFRRWKLGQQIGASFKALSQQFQAVVSQRPTSDNGMATPSVQRSNDTSAV